MDYRDSDGGGFFSFTASGPNRPGPVVSRLLFENLGELFDEHGWRVLLSLYEARRVAFKEFSGIPRGANADELVRKTGNVH